MASYTMQLRDCMPKPATSGVDDKIYEMQVRICKAFANSSPGLKTLGRDRFIKSGTLKEFAGFRRIGELLWSSNTFRFLTRAVTVG